MNETQIERDAKIGVGRLESGGGAVFGDAELKAGGSATQVEGEVRHSVGVAQDALGKVADQAVALAGKVSEQAKDAYGRASEAAHATAEQADEFVKERPYAALAVVAGASLLAGLLLGRGPKVVYLRTSG